MKKVKQTMQKVLSKLLASVILQSCWTPVQLPISCFCVDYLSSDKV